MISIDVLVSSPTPSPAQSVSCSLSLSLSLSFSRVAHRCCNETGRDGRANQGRKWERTQCATECVFLSFVREAVLHRQRRHHTNTHPHRLSLPSLLTGRGDDVSNLKRYRTSIEIPLGCVLKVIGSESKCVTESCTVRRERVLLLSSSTCLCGVGNQSRGTVDDRLVGLNVVAIEVPYGQIEHTDQ